MTTQEGPDMETTQTRNSSSTTRVVAAIAILLAVVAIGVAALQGGSDSSPTLATHLARAVNEKAYQAVTLSTGTVYYGKLSTKGDVLLLDDVYYLTGATQANPSGSLVKRGAEIYAPSGAMVLNPALVVQIDEVGSNSVIARGIDRIATGD